MKVMLMNPPAFHYSGSQYRMQPPLGLPILAAVLRRAGHEASVSDLEALGVSPIGLADKFDGQRDAWPDWIGFTSLTSSARGVEECIHVLRGIGYHNGIAVGGPAATLDPERFQAAGADLVVRGECEANIISLLEAGPDRPDPIVQGLAAPIESIPTPAWEVHRPFPRLYDGNAPDVGRPEGITMFSRGCPHACIFCGNPVFGRQAKRFRPPAAIEAEMKVLARMGMKAAFVYDDELIGTRHPPGWLEDVAFRIAPIGIVWKAQGRCSAKHASAEVLDLVYRAGGRVVMWGVESFSQRVLDANRKGIKVEDIWTVLRAAKNAGLRNWVFTMVGMYREEEADALLTAEGLALAYREGLIDYRQTTITTTMPGTEQHARAVHEGWYRPPPESGPQMHQVYQSTPWMTAPRIAYWRARFDEACPTDWRGKNR